MFQFSIYKFLKLKYSEFIINENKKENNLDESRIRIINDINLFWNGFKKEKKKLIEK